MGGLSIWHILLFAAVALLLFGGRGRISEMMGDLGKGISSFRKGLANPDDHPSDSADKKDTAAKS
jgi:sec-independent protein translocase protein TatA